MFSQFYAHLNQKWSFLFSSFQGCIKSSSAAHKNTRKIQIRLEDHIHVCSLLHWAISKCNDILSFSTPLSFITSRQMTEYISTQKTRQMSSEILRV
jgi:hypothetical protein